MTVEQLRRILLRGDPEADWFANDPVLARHPNGASEVGIVTDTLELVIGDNSTPFSQLPRLGIGGANNLNELSDVDTATTTPADGDGLYFDGDSGLWLPSAPPIAENLYRTTRDIREYGTPDPTGATSIVPLVNQALADLPAEGGTVVIGSEFAGAVYLVDAEIPVIGAPSQRAVNSEGGDKRVVVPKNVRLRVPDGYIGNVFAFRPSPTGQLTSNCVIQIDGQIYDPSGGRAFTTVRWISANGGTNGGVHFCRVVGNGMVTNPGVAGMIEATGAGPVIADPVWEVDTYYPAKWLSFIQPAGSELIRGGVFGPCRLQAGFTETTHIWENLAGVDHLFLGVNVYDAQSATVTYHPNFQYDVSILGGNLGHDVRNTGTGAHGTLIGQEKSVRGGTGEVMKMAWGEFAAGYEFGPGPNAWVCTPYASLGTFQPANGYLYIVPIYLASRQVISQLGTIVQTAGSAEALTRLGLYRIDTIGNTATLIADAGTEGAATVGEKVRDITNVPRQGLIGLGIVTQGAPATLPTYHEVIGGLDNQFIAYNSMTAAANSSTGGWLADNPGTITAALPATTGLNYGPYDMPFGGVQVV